MTKVCSDKQCRRAGRKLRLSEFPKNSRRNDGHGPYCSECWNHRMVEYRKQRKLLGRPIRPYVRRKPDIIAKAKDPIVRVYWAIVGGSKTLQEIRQKTKLSYDQSGDALAVLIWDYKVARIQDRRIILTDSQVSVAA